MNDSGSLGASAGSDRSQNSCDAGSDILAEEHVNSSGKSDHSADSQGLKNSDGCRGRLDNGGENHSGQNSD